MTREEFHAILPTLDYDDYIVRYRYKYLFENEWSYQNVIYYFNADEYKYEIIDDPFNNQEQIEVLAWLPVSEINLAAMSIVPLIKDKYEDEYNAESEEEDNGDDN